MPVWRYLSFDKFINLLIHREIQFTRATLFSDQNELRLLEAPKGKRELTKERVKQLEKRIARLRETTYISCWSLGMSESYPLWKIYLGGARNGVAIRTTVGRLRSSLDQATDNYFDGGVQYRQVVFEDDPTDEQLICTKLEAYTYEREYRVFTQLSPQSKSSSEEVASFTPNVLSEAVDLGSMLKYVYICPFSSSWFETTVRDSITRLAPDLQVEIRKSKIQDQ